MQTLSQAKLMSDLRSHMKDSSISLRAAAKDLGWNASTLNRQLSGRIGLRPAKEERIRAYVYGASSRRRRDEVVAAVKKMSDQKLELVMQFMQLMQRVDGSDVDKMVNTDNGPGKS